jgi:hypothetical protein
MNDRAELLRRRIAAYRRHLAEGVDDELAQLYLCEITVAAAELAEIEQGDKNRGRARS